MVLQRYFVDNSGKLSIVFDGPAQSGAMEWHGIQRWIRGSTLWLLKQEPKAVNQGIESVDLLSGRRTKIDPLAKGEFNSPARVEHVTATNDKIATLICTETSEGRLKIFERNGTVVMNEKVPCERVGTHERVLPIKFSLDGKIVYQLFYNKAVAHY